MPNIQCLYNTDPDASMWMYCPSFGAAIAFAVLFGLTTAVHSLQAILYRKPFALILIMGGAWETAGYIFRTLSVQHQAAEGFQTAQLLLIILAPLWINAFVYMLLGRMIHFYLAHDRVFNLRARRITLIFVLFDLTAFLVQVSGASMLNSTNPISTQHLGMHIYMAGVGVQIFFICIFMTLAIQFQRLVKKEDFYSHLHSSSPTHSPEPAGRKQPEKSARQAYHLLYVIYAVLLLIIFRNIYRLIEFSAGVDSSITTHEWYTWVFDSIPMLLCLIIFNIFHPGQVLRGPRSDFSEENKQRKEEKKLKKQEKSTAKEMKKMKRDGRSGEEMNVSSQEGY